MGNIIEIKGNLLDTPADIICHQVNCKGVMGAGLAKQIRARYPKVYDNYRKLCEKYDFGSILLGVVDFEEVDKYIVANCFGQWSYGTKVRQTDYDALERCFKSVADFALREELNVIAIPYGMGCGLAGGDWDEVYEIITRTFSDTALEVKIVKFN
jgi:O-acetyl-ADP-ribose deacetylase (regulator of RNase III)